MSADTFGVELLAGPLWHSGRARMGPEGLELLDQPRGPYQLQHHPRWVERRDGAIALRPRRPLRISRGLSVEGEGLHTGGDLLPWGEVIELRCGGWPDCWLIAELWQERRAIWLHRPDLALPHVLQAMSRAWSAGAGDAHAAARWRQHCEEEPAQALPLIALVLLHGVAVPALVEAGPQRLQILPICPAHAPVQAEGPELEPLHTGDPNLPQGLALLLRRQPLVIDVVEGPAAQSLLRRALALPDHWPRPSDIPRCGPGRSSARSAEGIVHQRIVPELRAPLAPPEAAAWRLWGPGGLYQQLSSSGPIQQRNRRLCRRSAVDGHAWLTLEGARRPARILDLSRCGAGLLSRQEAPIGAPAELELERSDRPPLGLRMAIAWRSPTARGWRLGLRLLSIGGREDEYGAIVISAERKHLHSLHVG
jgi:hypothetical protein